MTPLVLTVTFPYVTGNNARRHTSRGTYLTAKVKAYRMAVKVDVLRFKAAHPEVSFPLREKFDVEYQMFPPDRRRRDDGNHTKEAWDALTLAGLWADDSLIGNQIVHEWGEVSRPPFIHLIIRRREV